ncbi:MAG TPA: hypothetical protein VFP77_11285 [Gemmatimonadaceae bacterium]|nr:hypothetical protein [Gemmatimonadaceae bacterium]
MPAQESFSLHEPVQAVLEIRNVIDRSVHLDLGGNRKELFTVTIIRPDGQKTVSRLPQPYDSFSEIGRVDLAPQQSFSRTLVLNEWASFDREGSYEVEIAVPPPPGLSNRPDVQLSAAGVVRVVPPDPARLGSACEKLESEALHGSAEQQVEAGIALSFTTGDVCVPFMAKLLREKSFASEGAALGLARLGTPPAIAAIVKA